jgi:nicotinamide-nucleotide amidase
VGEAGPVAEGETIVRGGFPNHIVSEDGSTVEQVAIHRLIELGKTVATAESCTGGLIASRLTDVPGASAVFHRGYVTYANEAKAELLGVPEAVLEEFGAVSEPVVRAMAEGCLRAAKADFALAVTGIAGPCGGTPDKKVGTVFIARAQAGGETVVEKKYFPQGRDRFKLLTSEAAIDLLRRALV